MTDSQLRELGFVPFLGEGWTSYEDKPLGDGGIRIVIAGEVSEVTCYLTRFNDIIHTKNVVACVKLQMAKRRILYWDK